MQIGFPEQEFVIDVAGVDIRPLLPYFESHNWKKILFNGKFDIGFIRKNYGTTFRNVFDCMIAERVVDPASKWGNTFEDLALKRLNVVLDKSTRKSFVGKRSGEFTEKQLEYSADDVKYLFPLMEWYVEELTKLKLLHIAELEFDVVPVVADMEVAGVPVDKAKWRESMNEYEREWDESRIKTLSLFTGKAPEDFSQQLGLFGANGPSIPEGSKVLNLNSPQQLILALRKHGIIVEKTDEQHLGFIDHPIIRSLLEYKKLQKLVSSYGPVSDKAHPFTGRIHASWKQLGTETGRFSCVEPNLQQVPARLREAIGGEEDWLLVGADFSQMELRILAAESKDPILLEAFRTGQDIHTVTACTMFGLEPENVTKEQRYTAKTLNFGITYGMQARKFMDMMNAEAVKEGRPSIDIKEAGALVDRYRESYKVASKYLEMVGKASLRDGMTMTRYGRKRFFNPVSTDLPPKQYMKQIEGIKRQGANMPIQGTNADITKIAMVNIHNDLTDYGYRAHIILQVHDEIVLLAHKSQAEAVRPILVEAMEKAGQVIITEVPIKVDSYISEYWKK